MHRTRHALAQAAPLVAVFWLGGCPERHDPADPERDGSLADAGACADTRTCFAHDSIGCCASTGTEVSVCQACPTGTVERRDCRMSGCEDPCATDAGSADSAGAPRPPSQCVMLVAEGCCGSEVFAGDMCGRCPPGSVRSYECAGFVPSCGCEGAERILPAGDAGAADPLPAPRDAGAAPPPLDAGAQSGDAGVPLSRCRTWHGGGCCGEFVELDHCTGACPPGSASEDQCRQFASDPALIALPGDPPDRPVPPPFDAGLAVPSCRFDHGSGCCGEVVEPNLCGECPEDSLPVEQCVSYAPSC